MVKGAQIHSLQCPQATAANGTTSALLPGYWGHSRVTFLCNGWVASPLFCLVSLPPVSQAISKTNRQNAGALHKRSLAEMVINLTPVHRLQIPAQRT